jgi:hypothetical protein
MKLPRGEPASSLARLPDQLVGFWLILQHVKRYLHGAFHIVAEFSGFILCESFQRLLHRLVLPAARLIRLFITPGCTCKRNNLRFHFKGLLVVLGHGLSEARANQT